MATHGQDMLLNTWYAKRIIGDTGAADAASALLQTGVADSMWLLTNTTRLNASQSKLYGIKYTYDSSTSGNDKIEFYGGAANATSSNAWIQLNVGSAFFKSKVSIGNTSPISTNTLLEVRGKTLMKESLTLTHATPQILMTSTGTSTSTWYIQNSAGNFEITDGASQDATNIKAWSGYGFSIVPSLYINAAINPSSSSLYTLYVNGDTNIVGATILDSTLGVTGATTLTGAATLSSTLTVSGISTFNNEVDITVTGPVDTSGTSTTGALIIGSKDGNHLAFDNNSIHAYTNNGCGTLSLNPSGGDILIGGARAALLLDASGTGVTDWYVEDDAGTFSIRNNLGIISSTATLTGVASTYTGFYIAPRLYISGVAGSIVGNNDCNLYVTEKVYIDIGSSATTATKNFRVIKSSSGYLSIAANGIQAYSINNNNDSVTTLVLNDQGGNITIGKASSHVVTFNTTKDAALNGTTEEAGVVIKGGLYVKKQVRFGSTLNVAGHTTLASTSTLTGAVTMSSTVTIAGATEIDNTLTIKDSVPTILFDNTATGATDWKIETSQTAGVFTISDNLASNQALLYGYAGYGFVINPRLYIGYANALNNTNTYALYVNGTTNLDGAVTLASTLGITGLATLSGGLSTTSIAASGNIASDANVWAGDGTTNAEHDNGARSGAGEIYLYSEGSSTGNRGIKVKNTSASTATLLSVNQNNNINTITHFANGSLIFHTDNVRGGTTAKNANYVLYFKSSETDNKELATIQNIYNIASSLITNSLKFTITQPKASDPASYYFMLTSETTDNSTYSSFIESNLDYYIKKSTPKFYLNNTGITKGTVPSSNTWNAIYFRDSNDSSIGYIACGLTSNTNPTTQLRLALAPSVLNNVTTEGIILERTVTSGTIGPLTTTIDGNVTIQANTTTNANNYTRLRLSITDTTLNHTYGYDVLRMYHTHNSSSAGTNVTLGSGGDLFIGSGESAVNLYDAMYNAAMNHQLTGEDCYITSDGSIYLEAKADTIANRLGIKITNNGNLLPIATEVENDNVQNLGSSIARWKNIYGVTANISTLRFKHTSLVKGTNPSGNTWFGYIYAFESGDDYDQENRLAAQETRVTADGTCEYYARSYAFKTGSTEQVYLKLAITNAETPARSAEINGLLKLVNNDNTVTIGSQNANYCHIYNSENIPFAFNKTVLTTSGDLGNSSFPWGNLIIASGGRVSGNGGALYLGNSDNANWVYLQDCASQASGNPWKLTQAGVLTCVEVDIVKSTTIANRSSNPAAIYLKPNQTDNSLTYEGAYLAAYDDGDQSNYGANVVLSAGGNIIIGAGESGGAIYSNAVYNKTANANISVGANAAAFSETGENLILGADSAIYFLTNCNTIANRNLAYINTSGYFYSTRVYNAVWNDYAEFREAETEEPGYCVTESTNGCMIKTSQRLMPGCKLISDTYGTCMGETSTAKSPIAVAGRVLAYPYRAREEYKLGAAVCSAPGGTIDIMTRDEIMMYPERIIGTVSEIPLYDIWQGGSGTSIPVNGRIWIYVR